MLKVLPVVLKNFVHYAQCNAHIPISTAIMQHFIYNFSILMTRLA